jgi:hypothetical protein
VLTSFSFLPTLGRQEVQSFFCGPSNDTAVVSQKSFISQLGVIPTKRQCCCKITASSIHFAQDFMDAKKAEQAVSFFVQLYVYLDDDQHVEELTLDNWQTQERLVIKEHRDKDYDVSISRFPIGANAEWIEHMAKDPIFEYRNLRIFC